MKRTLIISALCLAVTAVAYAGVNIIAAQSDGHVMVSADQVKWNKMGPGSEFAVLSGDPQKEGSPFVARFKFSDGAKIAPHWHPVDENVTVISGTFFMGQGEKFDESVAHEMKAGAFALMPKEMRHFAWVKGETIIQVHGIGPFKIFWVDQGEKKPE